MSDDPHIVIGLHEAGANPLSVYVAVDRLWIAEEEKAGRDTTRHDTLIVAVPEGMGHEIQARVRSALGSG